MSKIYVDEIASKTGTADALSISSTGAIYPKGLSYWPAFKGRRLSGLTASANDEVVIWNGTEFDNGGNYSSSTGKFTCPIAGMYLVSTTLLDTDSSVQDNFDLMHDDTPIVKMRNDQNSAHDTITGTGVVNAAAGDTLYLKFTSSGDSIIGSDTQRWSTISIAYLGG